MLYGREDCGSEEEVDEVDYDQEEDTPWWSHHAASPVRQPVNILIDSICQFMREILPIFELSGSVTYLLLALFSLSLPPPPSNLRWNLISTPLIAD